MFFLPSQFSALIPYISHPSKMPRRSFKQAVLTDAQELLGFSLLIDLIFNEPEEEDLGSRNCNRNLLEIESVQDWSRMKNSAVEKSEGNGTSVIAEDIEELCEILLIAIPNIRYLAPRVSLPRGIGFWSNVCSRLYFLQLNIENKE